MTTTNSYTNSAYQAKNFPKFDGVVKIYANGKAGVGVILYDGAAILTGAHVVEGTTSYMTIHYETEDGVVYSYADDYAIHEDYNGISNYSPDGDVAIVWLSGSVPLPNVTRYDLYRDTDEIGQIYEAVGYGLTSTGNLGTSTATQQKTVIENTFDLGYDYNNYQQDNYYRILVSDFDNGTSTNDTLNQLFGVSHTGVGYMEGMGAPGDSGGPAFLDGKVAGINTAISRNPGTDINNLEDSSFGDYSYLGRVSSYQEWIDKQIRNHYHDAPTTVANVQKSIVEGDTLSGDGLQSTVYFYIYYSGDRSKIGDILSVNYRTIDGTAKAWEDYVPVEGQLNIYFDENYAVIPVEILQDTAYEADEVFGLEIYNPHGASFANNVDTLTAYRTILNDDVFIA